MCLKIKYIYIIYLNTSHLELRDDPNKLCLLESIFMRMRQGFDRLAKFTKAKTLADIEQELWDALNFNDICSALATEGATDEDTFVRAVHECDSDKVFILRQRAIQSDIDYRTQKEYDRHTRARETPKPVKRWKEKTPSVNGGCNEQMHCLRLSILRNRALPEIPSRCLLF